MGAEKNSIENPETGTFAFEALDRVLHEKARLGILSSLAIHPSGLLFNELKALCSLTDGNLSRHMQVLQDARLVEVWKSAQGKRPLTLVRLTEEGKARFQEYLTELEKIVAMNMRVSTTRDSGKILGKKGWRFSPA